MRTLKFRVWDALSNEMYYDVDIEERRLRDLDGDNDQIYMQYVEFKDINNKEIYEGDILKEKNNPFLYRIEIGKHWVNGYQQYGLHTKINRNPNYPDFVDSHFDLTILDKLEIIGNIYQSETIEFPTNDFV